MSPFPQHLFVSIFTLFFFSLSLFTTQEEHENKNVVHAHNLFPW